MIEMVTRPHVDNFVRWAKDKPEVLVLTGDLTSSCEVGKFRDTYPERYFSMGMAEQNMLSVAAGLAREGFYPYIHTFAVFIYRRPYDQLAMSVAYPNLPVRMMAFLPGITTPGGVTHQAIEDVAIMRATPNMTVFDTGDATEVETVLDVAQAVDGPVYVRFLRGVMPRLFPKSEPFQFNKARILSEGNDLTILSSSVCTEEALRAVKLLKEKGLTVQHLHVSTLKPFTDPQVLDALHRAKHGVITMENHTTIGGLGSASSELMTDHGIGKKLICLGLKDTYAHGASREYLMKEYKLDALSLVEAAESLTGKTFGIKEDDLLAVQLEEAKEMVNTDSL